jgi:flagellar hook-length control protein FliK
MNAAPIPPRDVKPADRPPPRDPQAAGASDGTRASEEARFTDLVKEAASEAESSAKAQDRATTASEADKAKQAQEKASADAATADSSTRLADAAWTENTGAETAGAKTPPEMALPSLALAQPQPPVPPTHGSEPAQTGATADEAAGRQDHGRILSSHGVGLPMQSELNPASNAREPQSAVEQFEALLSASQTPADITPPAPTAPSTTAAGRLSEPPPALAASQVPQPPLPVAALPASIAIKALAGSNRFDIRLDPEELGRIDVALEIDGDGTIRASIAAEKPEALQLIVREARALEQAFDQAGFRRDEGALNFSLSDRQSSPHDQQNPQHRPQMTRFFVDGEGELPPSLAALVHAGTSRADGRLDVRI